MSGGSHHRGIQGWFNVNCQWENSPQQLWIFCSREKQQHSRPPHRRNTFRGLIDSLTFWLTGCCWLLCGKDSFNMLKQRWLLCFHDFLDEALCANFVHWLCVSAWRAFFITPMMVDAMKNRASPYLIQSSAKVEKTLALNFKLTG